VGADAALDAPRVEQQGQTALVPIPQPPGHLDERHGDRRSAIVENPHLPRDGLLAHRRGEVHVGAQQILGDDWRARMHGFHAGGGARGGSRHREDQLEGAPRRALASGQRLEERAVEARVETQPGREREPRSEPDSLGIDRRGSEDRGDGRIAGEFLSRVDAKQRVPFRRAGSAARERLERPCVQPRHQHGPERRGVRVALEQDPRRRGLRGAPRPVPRRAGREDRENRGAGPLRATGDHDATLRLRTA